MDMAPPGFSEPLDKTSLESLVNEVKKCELAAIFVPGSTTIPKGS